MLMTGKTMRRVSAITCFFGVLVLGRDESAFGEHRGPSSRESHWAAGPLSVDEEVGRFGGSLVISERSEPKTFNPLTAIDDGSLAIIGLMTGDLIHINRYTQRTEPALASRWEVSKDGRRYVLHLRPGLQFSDGSVLDADDVVFSFQSYLDATVGSPQRDLLIVAGKPIAVSKVDERTVAFTLAAPYAAAERLFDGLAIMPKRLLERNGDAPKLASAWGLSTRPEAIAGAGPFRLKEYVPGQRIVLERNPYYWKNDARGQRLPYLQQIVCLFAANADAESMRFDAGETDVISGLSAADFATIESDQVRRHFHLFDLGPGLEYDFLFFNQNVFGPVGAPVSSDQQAWFEQADFRKAISNAIDRAALVRLAYRGRAYALAVQVTPGERLWVDEHIAPPTRSLEAARKLLASCGFTWAEDGSLRDKHGRSVRFSLTINAGNPQQVQMATLVQQDLKDIGIDVKLTQLEFRTFLNRIFSRYQYEAALMALDGGDSDPNSVINFLQSTGGSHVWCLKGCVHEPAWQREIDQLMEAQLTANNYAERKRLYDRVQELMWKNEPVIFLVSPHVLVGAKDRVGNFRPAILSDHTLWNADQLFIRQ